MPTAMSVLSRMLCWLHMLQEQDEKLQDCRYRSQSVQSVRMFTTVCSWRKLQRLRKARTQGLNWGRHSTEK